MTKRLISLCTAGLLVLSFSCYGQNKEHSRLGLEVARQELQYALKKGYRLTSITSPKPLIDSAAAVHLAEPFLYCTYGEKRILETLPFELYLVDSYWVLMGTLSEDSNDGTFTIILDSRNSGVIEITHGK